MNKLFLACLTLGLVFIVGTTAGAQESLKIDGGFALSSAGEAVITLSGDWVNNGTLNNGNIVFNGVTEQTIDNPNGETFRRLTIANSSEVVMQTPVEIIKSVALVSGTLANSAENPLTLAAGAWLGLGDGQTSAEVVYSGPMSVEYIGTTPVITGNELPDDPNQLQRLTIANPAGVTLDRNVTVNESLIFEAGLLATDQHTVTLASSAQIIGEANNTRLVGHINTTRQVGTASDNLGNIGVALGNGDENLGSVTVNRFSGADAAATIGNHPSITKRWQITADQPPVSGRNLTMTWFEAEDNGNDPSNALAWRSADGSAWTRIGEITDAGPQRTLTVATNSFSSWTVRSFRPSGLAGDVNADYVVDSVDIELIAYFILYDSGLAPVQQEIADVSNNGRVDVGDITRIVDQLQ